MRLIKRLVDFYVFGNIHVALAAASLSLITMHYFGVFDYLVPLFIFFSTLLSYNFIRLYRRPELDSWFYKWVTQHRKLLRLIALCSLLMLIYLTASLNLKALILLAPLAVLTYFYSVPPMGQVSLRVVPGFKLFLIAAVWAVVTVFLPAIQYEIKLSTDLLITFIQRVFFIAAITLPFDLRDLNFDKSTLKTVPQVHGVQKTKKIGLLLLMLFLGLNFLKNESAAFINVEFVITLASLGLLLRATSNQHRYYSAFFVEALPILWLIGLLLDP